jgi:group I intron endonuclease
MESGVYTIKNLANGKFYVGQTTKLYNRKEWHFSRLRNNKHPNKHLQRAYNRYGRNNFTFEIIETCAIDILLSREHHWCLLLGADKKETGYNIRPTGEDKYCPHTEETRRKISKSQRGKITPEEVKEKIRIALLGRSLSKEHVKKIADGNRGKKRGFYKGGVNRKVVVINTETKDRQIFDSISICAAHFKLPPSNISLYLKNGKNMKKIFKISYYV